jgi:hypothetical protein
MAGREFLRVCMAHVGQQMLYSFEHQLQDVGILIDPPPVTKAAERDVTMNDHGQWRSKVRHYVDRLVVPDATSWCENESALSDRDYAQLAVSQFKTRFRVTSKSPEGRISLIKEIVGMFDTFPLELRLSLSLLSPIMTTVNRLLAGPDSEVTSMVRSEGLRMLARALYFHGLENPGDRDGVLNLVRRWILDTQKTVRISAGYVIPFVMD